MCMCVCVCEREEVREIFTEGGLQPAELLAHLSLKVLNLCIYFNTHTKKLSVYTKTYRHR